MNLKKALFLVSLFAMMFGASAFAAEGTDASMHTGGIAGLGAALAIAVAAFGGALAQGRTASAALDGIARNPAAQPKIFTSMIIGLALIESLVIYALVIAFAKY